jgi:hypothetical protein
VGPGFRSSWSHDADRKGEGAGQQRTASVIKRREPESVVTRLHPELASLMHRIRHDVDMQPQAASADSSDAPVAAPRRLAVGHPRSCGFQVDRQYRHGLEAHGGLVGSWPEMGARVARRPRTASASKDALSADLRGGARSP